MARAFPLHQQPFVVVDLETTGGSAIYDRVIEVAALRVQGGRVLDRFETLVNPGVSVPPFITRLTGISTAMVSGRPRLEAALPALGAFIGSAPVVAHNAAFDHAFLSAAFRRAAIPWEAEKVCTLRLARRLIPGLHSYKLDSLCAHLGLAYVQRHRAGPDADATVALLTCLLERAAERGVEGLGQLLQVQKEPIGSRRRKAGVDEAQVASLPTGPGVYLLKDAQGHIVYVGKSVNIRSRVRTHLRPSGTASNPAQPRLRKRLPSIADVEGIETESELEALFLESRLVKRYLPDANRLLRDFRDYPFIKLDLSDAYPRLTATRERPMAGGLYFGPFRKASVVARVVLFLSEQLGLRQCKGPLGRSACALLDLGKCLGPCVGAVTQAEYRSAAQRASAILGGEDDPLLEHLAQRRDALAEELRFEEAAELRDQLRDVEQVVGAHRRLRAVAERNLVIITPEKEPAAARLLLVRGGRLAGEVSLRLPARLAELRVVLGRVYPGEPVEAISRDYVDDMLILEAWLRRRGESAREVPIPAEAPETALPILRAALRELAAGFRVSPKPEDRPGRRAAAEPARGEPVPAPGQSRGRGRRATPVA